MADFSSWDLKQMKQEVIAEHRECCQRGLLHSAKWAAEIAFALDHIKLPQPLTQPEESQDFLKECDLYTLAKCYFDLREYERAAHLLQGCTSAKVYFLCMYAQYLAGEKRRLDNASDSIGPQDNIDLEKMKSLRREFHSKYKTCGLDGYSLYLYGIVLKKLDLLKEAVTVLTESVHKAPLHWGAWLELSLLITDKDTLSGLSLPDHWVKQLFLAHTYLELQMNEEAMKMYENADKCGLTRSTYIMAQKALAYHNLRDVDLAVESFAKLQKFDPYRIENMDTYSNLLYVKEMRTELATLAHHCCDIDKYRVETCCIIGNYYSLRSQHEKAVLYFQRALKLNPNYLSAWTLMGHEYMELKNTPAAIQAYRHAIEVNRRDYRAWYGLGQTYEILKMPFYCLYYYRQAQMLRPNDSRMVVALGETYEKLERLQEAKKCFWKAHSLGDIEGLALIKLARLYERLSEEDQAAAAFTEYIVEMENQGMCGEEHSQAYRYLANYHVKRGQLDDAYTAALKCTEFTETREEGKALLRQISRLRALGTNTNGLQESVSSNHQVAHLQEGSDPAQPPLPRMNLLFTP
ncbi:hypothetical protein NP493_72g01031 [Ridgeia piscesae]|uniref:Cyclosome subunit 8 n=1 Tax=Ridgeia piscesae TaxID=27915 RepID=A0AAD9P9U0_RIDPI|nr:hypothetical protein NP493_72g01031 [Ridgeia piscesae]